MQTINVLVARGALSKADLDKLQAIDPRIRVRNVPYDIPWSEHSARQRALSVEKCPPEPPVSSELRQALAEAEVMYCFDIPLHTRALAPRLKWVQQQGAGIETLLCSDLMDGSVIVTNNRAGKSYPIGDFVWGGILYFAKLKGFFDMAKQRKWSLSSNQDVRGKTLGVVGLGAIGMEVAKRAPTFGMRVVGMKFRPAMVPGVDRVYGPKELNQMLAESDFVVLTLPLTHATLGMFNRPQFEAMKPGSYLINVARGAIVDTIAVVWALNEGRLAGALLDVQAEEPVLPDSPLWDVPNLYLTPHSSGAVPNKATSSFDTFVDNLCRYVKGEPLKNVIDTKLGF